MSALSPLSAAPRCERENASGRNAAPSPGPRLKAQRVPQPRPLRRETLTRAGNATGLPRRLGNSGTQHVMRFNSRINHVPNCSSVNRGDFSEVTHMKTKACFNSRLTVSSLLLYKAPKNKSTVKKHILLQQDYTLARAFPLKHLRDIQESVKCK